MLYSCELSQSLKSIEVKILVPKVCRIFERTQRGSHDSQRLAESIDDDPERTRTRGWISINTRIITKIKNHFLYDINLSCDGSRNPLGCGPLLGLAGTPSLPLPPLNSRAAPANYATKNSIGATELVRVLPHPCFRAIKPAPPPPN